MKMHVKTDLNIYFSASFLEFLQEELNQFSNFLQIINIYVLYTFFVWELLLIIIFSS